MKAIYFDEHGGPEVLQYGDLDDPAPGPGEVLLAVKAASLNHIDIFLRRGVPGVKIALPHVPGCDASGVVEEVGEGVTSVAVGDRVLINPSMSCGACEFCERGDSPLCLHYKIFGEHVWGTLRDRLVAPEDNVIRIPDDLSFEEAAAAPLVFVTAWRMLVTRGQLKRGEDILILGAAAGVGTACIQIAKQLGARVFAAASSDEKLELCKQLGADVLINYEQEDFAQRVRAETGKKGVEVCVDYVGKTTWVKSLRSTARGGRVVTCGATTGFDPNTDLRHIFYRQLSIMGSTMGTKAELMAPLELIFNKDMKSVVGNVFELEDAAEAHRLMEQRGAVGKIVIRI